MKVLAILLPLMLWMGCSKKAAPPSPQRLSHDFRVAARKWIREIDGIHTDPRPREWFGKGAKHDKLVADMLYSANGKQFDAAWKLDEEAKDQRENDADNAAYQLLQNYFNATFIVASDRVYQAFKGEHDSRCPNDSCSAIYGICQKEAQQTLESGERISSPQCKVGSNGVLPGVELGR
jgi:hypothetical protein